LPSSDHDNGGVGKPFSTTAITAAFTTTTISTAALATTTVSTAALATTVAVLDLRAL